MPEGTVKNYLFRSPEFAEREGKEVLGKEEVL